MALSLFHSENTVQKQASVCVSEDLRQKKNQIYKPKEATNAKLISPTSFTTG